MVPNDGVIFPSVSSALRHQEAGLEVGRVGAAAGTMLRLGCDLTFYMLFSVVFIFLKGLQFYRRVSSVEFRPIESKRPGSQQLSSIGSRVVGTTMLIFDIDSEQYCNGRRYLALFNDYHQRSAALPS
ncbi:hypothetical protein EVAR_96298_1 [Eumeta japonica]|uniref:Uncharacterized protein n=1 Tax=Eumeta variegata TaxID=151549 RepID=A0A4C1VWS6_EUMVA|nr:hypothetical protein EVAR_96298_1 [Eumeta japonica]